MAVQTRTKSPIINLLLYLFDIFFLSLYTFCLTQCLCVHVLILHLFFMTIMESKSKCMSIEREWEWKHKNERIMYTCIYRTQCFESRGREDVKWCVFLLSTLNSQYETSNEKKNERGRLDERGYGEWFEWVATDANCKIEEKYFTI